MKRILSIIVVFVCLGVGYVQAQVATFTVVTSLVGLGIAVYNATPEADYVVQFAGSDGEVKYTKADSCDEALMQAYQALKNGAEYAFVKSNLPTVNGSCRSKRYEQSDIEFLEKKLGYR